MVLADLRAQLQPFYSDIGRPSVDPEPMMRNSSWFTVAASAMSASFVRWENNQRKPESKVHANAVRRLGLNPF
jgi:hypothetical protein